MALAKMQHDWGGHLTAAQQALAVEDIWEPATPAEAAAAPADHAPAASQVEDDLRAAGLPTSPRRSIGWICIETPGEEDAVWLLRAVLVEQVLARREDHVLYLPVGATPDARQVARVGRAFRQDWDLRKASAPRRTAWRGSGSLG